MTQPTTLAHILSESTEDLAPEVQTFLLFLTRAHALTPTQLALINRYEALTPERQSLVDNLIRELGKLPTTSPSD